jgi:arginine decarboxylase
MPKPTSRILVVNDAPKALASVVRGLNAAARSLDNPFGLVAIGVASAAEAIAAIENDGDIQAALVDDRLYGLGDAGADTSLSAVELVRHINALRPEVDVFILIDRAQEDDVVDSLFTESVDGYFYREEHDPRGMFRIIQAALAERARTPFFDALRSYVLMAKDAWHTPGHSSGDSLRDSPWVSDFHEFMGEHAFDADLSVSVPMLDSLLEPRGVIADAQKLAARAFGARRTYFSTNGTSTSNKIIFQTLLSPGEKLLLDRNCHKSVHHGVVLSGARPVYLDASVNPQYGLYGPVPKATLLDAISAHPDAKALILTSCTYDGLRYDLPPIIAAAHAKGIKVIIDEAWYGFARFHPTFRPTALEAGADYATQSTHKVLSAFSQASMIHVNDPDFDEHGFRENFMMHTSTSPQYAMIASLDVARKQASLEGFRLLSRTLALAAELRQQLDATGVFRVLGLEDLVSPALADDGIRLDPTKITVDIAGCGHTSDELQRELFERFGIQVEKSTFRTVSLLLTIGTTRSKVSRLYDAFMRIARERRPPLAPRRLPDLPRFGGLRLLPRDAFYTEGEQLPLLDDADGPDGTLVGRVAADAIVPYPPGIPVVVPGQIITADLLAYLAGLLRSPRREEIHGLVTVGHRACLRVVTRAEEAALPPLAT